MEWQRIRNRPDVGANLQDCEEYARPCRGLARSLDIDFMDFLNFITAIHHRLGVDIPERDYPKLVTLDGAVAYIAARLGSIKNQEPRVLGPMSGTRKHRLRHLPDRFIARGGRRNKRKGAGNAEMSSGNAGGSGWLGLAGGGG